MTWYARGKKSWTQVWLLSSLTACSWASEPKTRDPGLNIGALWLENITQTLASHADDDLETLRQHIWQAAHAHGFARVRDGAQDKEDVHNLKVSLLPVGQDGHHAIEVALINKRARNKALSTIVSGPAADAALSPEAWQPGIKAAIGDLRQVIKVGAKGTEALVAWVTSDANTNQKILALDALTQARAEQVVGPLCKSLAAALNSQDVSLLAYSVRQRAIGALAEMGDPNAVSTLIALSQHQDHATVAQVALAVGALGGNLAKAYLVTLASGHGDPEVRQSAQQALKDAQAQERKAAPHEANNAP